MIETWIMILRPMPSKSLEGQLEHRYLEIKWSKAGFQHPLDLLKVAILHSPILAF